MSIFSKTKQFEARCKSARPDDECHNSAYSDESWPFQEFIGESLKYHRSNYPTKKGDEMTLSSDRGIKELYDRRRKLKREEEKLGIDKNRLLLIPLDFEFGPQCNEKILSDIKRHLSVHLHDKVEVTVTDPHRLLLPEATLEETINDSQTNPPSFIWRCPIVKVKGDKKVGNAIVRSSYSQQPAKEGGAANTTVHYYQTKKKGKGKKEASSSFVTSYGHKKEGAEIEVTASKVVFPSQLLLSPHGSSSSTWMQQSVEILNNYLEEDRRSDWDDIMHFTNQIQWEHRDKMSKLVPAALILTSRNLFYATRGNAFGSIEGAVSLLEPYRPGILSEATYIDETLNSSLEGRNWCDYASPVVPRSLAAWKAASRYFCRTVLHEYLHIFDFAHCAYYPCAQNGANSVQQGKDQPFVNCPITSRRIALFWEFEETPEDFEGYKRDLKNYMDKEFNHGQQQVGKTKKLHVATSKSGKIEVARPAAPSVKKSGDLSFPNSSWKKQNIMTWAADKGFVINMKMTKKNMLQVCKE